VNPRLLDTCAILWLASDPEQLSGRARELLLHPDSKLYVSSISAWEIALKVKKRKLVLPVEPRQWWQEMFATHRPEQAVLSRPSSPWAPSMKRCRTTIRLTGSLSPQREPSARSC
jgi:PIN domain nuclease of toxin-antitoxin system